NVYILDLLAVVATPDPKLEDPVSGATRVVWDAMESLARRSQHTVKQCGNGIRMAAIRTMPHQTLYQPLRAYMDEKNRLAVEAAAAKIKVYKYKSPLIYAMTMLGRGEVTWQGPESYPPIISWYMEIIRMWAAAAEQGSWTGNAADEELGFIINKGHHHNLRLWGPDVGSSQDWTSEQFREVLNAFPNNVQVEREQEMATMEADEDLDKIGNITDEQAGHTPHVAGMIYGREVTKFEGSTTTRRLKFRASSTDWH
ncbi:hypothetical protein AOCH_006947, partial [Aspergillus ochraceoroseus]